MRISAFLTAAAAFALSASAALGAQQPPGQGPVHVLPSAPATIYALSIGPATVGVQAVTLSKSCERGRPALTLGVMIYNYAQPTPAVSDTHGIWAQDTALPGWSGGIALPVIGHNVVAVQQIPIAPYSPGASMLGSHTFKVTVNGKPWFPENDYSDNSVLLHTTIPDGFCGFHAIGSVHVQPGVQQIAPTPGH